MELLPERKLAGILAPLFALKGVNDLGVGDVGALRELVDWSASNGFHVVQLLPVNETGNDNSPYNAISSVALDPITIEITPASMPDLSAAEIKTVKERFFFRHMYDGPVLYQLVKPLKRVLMQRAFENFKHVLEDRKAPRTIAFENWCEAQSDWLPGFAMFRVLMDEHSNSERWDRWPLAHQTRASALEWLKQQPQEVQSSWEEKIRQICYVQWIVWSQWTEVKAYADSKGVALMGDVPFGVSLYSADYFCRPEIFDDKWSGGAPPEPAFQGDQFTARWGQNWGVPLYRWDVLLRCDLDWWRQRVRKIREVFHFFRIDHVLGFYRIYGFPWRPEKNAEFAPLTDSEAQERTGGPLPRFQPRPDNTGEERAANRVDGERLLGALAEETGKYRLMGEDLGTVPDYVRPSLRSLDICGFKVPMWEKEWDSSLTPGEAYEPLSVATYATHDHDPLRLMWERWMDTIALGESGMPGAAQKRDQAWWEVRRLAKWAGFEVPRMLPFSHVHEQFLRGLLACNSWIVVFMVTDLFGTTQRFNVPGAVADSNWSERIALPVSEWRNHKSLAGLLERLRTDLARSG
jgi:4-alpha-glucanotransferase